MLAKSIPFFLFTVISMLVVGHSHAIEFSADMVITAEGQQTSGKIYSKPEQCRMEITKPERIITIMRLDKKIAWNIIPSEKMYMEMQVDPTNMPRTEIHNEIERKLVGSEIIDGHPTKKFLITYKEGEKIQQIYQWLATDIDFPVKTASIDNSWIQEYKNVKIGPQPKDLFEAPAGYEKMQMPTMPGGMRFK